MVLLRMCSLPIQDARATWLDHDPSEVDRSSSARTVIRSWWDDDPAFREAVEIASPSLARVADKISDGRTSTPKSVRRCLISLAKYRIRMATRPTPFGVMAGVAVGTVAQDRDDEGHFSFETDWTRVTRPDMAWLSAVVRDLETRPDVLRTLRISPNNVLLTRGERIGNPFPARRRDDHVHDESNVQEISLRRSDAIDFALSRAAGGIPCPELFTALDERYPEVDHDQIGRFVEGLIASEFLVSDLWPPLTASDPLGHVIDRLPRSLDHEFAALRRLPDLFVEYHDASGETGRAAYRELVTAAREVHDGDQAVQVDLVRDAKLVLPRIVVHEARRAVAALRQVTGPPAEPDHLREYRTAFLERYGADAFVGLSELLDPEIGLGPPATYRFPPALRRVAQPTGDDGGSDRAARRADTLLRWATAVLRSDEPTLELTRARIEEISEPHPERDHFPAAEGCFHLCATSLTAAQAGEFELVASQPFATTPYGATFGRFLEGLERAYPGTVRVMGDPYSGAAAVSAHLDYAVDRPRLGNVMAHPRILPNSIAVGVFDDHRADGAITLDDLVVHASTTRFSLHQVSTGREVRPVSFTRMNANMTSNNIVRFLREIGFGPRPSSQQWDWGDIDRLPALPRVRHGRTVLAAAQWRPGADLCDASATFTEWQRRLAAWRDRYRVPDVVQVYFRDHRIELDLESLLHRHILRDELVKNPRSIVRESIETRATSVAWSNSVSCELVIPLPPAGPSPSDPVDTVPRAPTTHVEHHPGEEWISTSLYCDESRHDPVLAGALGQLLQELPDVVDRWFFLRYRDPDPHIRLRLHVDPGVDPRARRDVEATVLACLADLCRTGVANRFAVVGYRPELQRYGHGRLLARAEEHFMHGSRRALRTIRAGGDDQHGLSMHDTCILDMAAMYRALLGDEWADVVVSTVPRIGLADGDRDRVTPISRLFDRIVGRDDGVEEFWPRPTLHDYARTYGHTPDRERPSTLVNVADSFCHLHHNRLLGIDRTSERGCLAVLRSMALGAVRRS